MLGNIFSLSLLFLELQAAIINITVGGGGTGIGFIPATVNATVGDTINFTWITGLHNVVQTNDDTCDTIKVDGITSGLPIDELGKKFNFTVTEPGNFWYICQVHCKTGMKGVIIVNSEEPTGTATAIPTLRYPGDEPGDYPIPTSETLGDTSLTVWVTFCLSIGTITVINLLL